MAIALIDKTRVEAPSVDYPYGNIKDTIPGDKGTPVNKEVYADMHQFFEKIMADSGVVANGLPENFTNGFQFFEALWKTFSNVRVKTKIIEIGDWDMVLDPTKLVAHGIADYLKIYSTKAVILHDGGSGNSSLLIDSIDATGLSQGQVNLINPTTLTLVRTAGGFFDSASYSTTPFNRGWIVITYED